MTLPVDWLLSGEPWVDYRTRLDLLGEGEYNLPVQAARAAMLADPAVQALLAELAGWPGAVIASHKSAGQPFHKLTFAADLGLQPGDPGVDVVVERILAHPSPEGPFQLPVNIPEYHGGSGQEQWAWALCDAPLVVYALFKMGLGEDERVQRALDHLVGLVRENGWPCALSANMNFRGPGRKEDPCPFATLAMLKALSADPARLDSPAAHSGAECLLSLWHDSLQRHPYIFYMGDDFRKLKVPLVWYDLMHVLDVLTAFPFTRRDPRLLEMTALLQSKADPNGRFTLESVWTAWKGWEFGQKKQPSRWLTLLAWRILRRVR